MVMIENLSTIIQQDVVQMIDYARGKKERNPEQTIRTLLAASRVLATLGMAFAGILALAALKTFVVSSVVGAVCLGAIAVGIYAFSHDVFLICKNGSEQQQSFAKQAVGEARSFFQDIKDIVVGKKDTEDAPRCAVTDGTFFRPLWDVAIDELSARIDAEQK